MMQEQILAQIIGHQLFGLETGNVGYFKIERGTFAAWSRKFEDNLEYLGKNWSETEKLGFLKCKLDGLAREQFENIPVNSRKTVMDAIECLKAIIDSPKALDFAKRKLNMCY